MRVWSIVGHVNVFAIRRYEVGCRYNSTYDSMYKPLLHGTGASGERGSTPPHTVLPRHQTSIWHAKQAHKRVTIALLQTSVGAAPQDIQPPYKLFDSARAVFILYIVIVSTATRI